MDFLGGGVGAVSGAAASAVCIAESARLGSCRRGAFCVCYENAFFFLISAICDLPKTISFFLFFCFFVFLIIDLWVAWGDF